MVYIAEISEYVMMIILVSRIFKRENTDHHLTEDPIYLVVNLYTHIILLSAGQCRKQCNGS